MGDQPTIKVQILLSLASKLDNDVLLWKAEVYSIAVRYRYLLVCAYLVI